MELAHRDILAALAAENVAYDMIYISFALHHLPTAQKAEFFQLAAQRLNKGGLLLLVDVVGEENETLEVYHERYCNWLRSSFNTLNGDEKNLICDHIVNNDLPDSFSVLQAQAQAGGAGGCLMEHALWLALDPELHARIGERVMQSVIPNCAGPPRHR